MQACSKGTVSELLVAYLAHAERYYRKRDKPTSELHHLTSVGRWLIAAHGLDDVADLTPARLRALQESMAVELSRDTVNAYCSRIKAVWGWGVERDLVPPACWWALKAVKGIPRGRGLAREGKGVEPVPSAWLEPTFAHLAPDIATAARLQLLTGMRPGEVCGLGRAALDRSVRPWRYDVPDAWNKLAHKGIRRVVFFGRRAQQLLRPLLTEAGRDGRDHVFHVRQRPLTTVYYGQLVRAAAEKAGMPRWSPNRLRHNAATDIEAEFGLEAAMNVLGHADVSMTRRYALKSTETARRVALAR